MLCRVNVRVVIVYICRDCAWTRGSSLCVLLAIFIWLFRRSISIFIGMFHRTILMASGDSQPGAHQSGINFWVHVQIPCNAPESPGVVVVDTSCVPDVLGLRTRDAEAAPVRVLPGRALDCVLPECGTCVPAWDVHG